MTLLPNVELGLGCKVNVNATIHHDSKIGDFCTIAPGALILGNVHIESGAYVGAGAIIKQRCHIGAGAVIGAGSVVTKTIEPYSIAVGNPAEVIKSRNRVINYKSRYFPFFDTDIQ